MEAIALIKCDFLRPVPTVVHAVQNDKDARKIRMQLSSGGTLFDPTGLTIAIRFRKPDGTGGFYTSLKDEETDEETLAYTVEADKSLTIILAEQVLTVPGPVLLEVNFYSGSGQKLTTLAITVMVAPSVLTDAQIVSEDYYNVLTAQIAEFAEAYSTGMAELAAFVGAPRTAATVAGMTDHDHIYVYTGSETGYTWGCWYYWDGSAWTYGGVYETPSITPDTTLTHAGMAADAEATGNAISAVKTELQIFEASAEVVPTEFASGKIGATGGTGTDNTRIRSKASAAGMKKIRAGDYWFCDESYKIQIFIYTGAGMTTNTFVARLSSTFKNGLLQIPLQYVGKYSSVCIQKVGSTSSDISADVETINQHVYLCSAAKVSDEAVRIATQTLTDTQKSTARSNIGAAASDAAVQITAQTFTETEKGIARSNIGAADVDTVTKLVQWAGIEQDISSRFSFTDGKRISYSTGEQQGDSGVGLSASGFVNIEGFDRIRLTVLFQPSKTQNGLAFYSDASAASYLSGKRVPYDPDLSTSTYKVMEYDIPSGAKYVRTTWYATTSAQYATPFSCEAIVDGASTDKSTELPDYYFEDDYLPDRVAAINANRLTMGRNSFEFVWFTDLHVYNNSLDRTRNAMNSVKLCQYIAQWAGIDTVYCGGDLVDNGNVATTKEDCMEILGGVRAYLDPIWDHVYPIIGNHEWNNPSGNKDTEQLPLTPIRLLLTQDAEKRSTRAVFDDNGTSRVSAYGSYIIDDPVKQIRTLFLGCSDSAIFTLPEYKWLGKVLESTPQGWSLLVMSHIGVTNTVGSSGPVNDNFERFTEMLDAAKAADNDYTLTWTVDQTTYSAGPFDFSNFADVTIIGVICGHNHQDKDYTTTGGIHVISTTCDRGPKSNSSADFIAARAFGTVKEQALDVCQVDITNGKLYMTRIGGSWDGAAALQNPDREFSF